MTGNPGGSWLGDPNNHNNLISRLLLALLQNATVTVDVGLQRRAAEICLPIDLHFSPPPPRKSKIHRPLLVVQYFYTPYGDSV